jgi:hypothetical protein
MRTIPALSMLTCFTPSAGFGFLGGDYEARLVPSGEKMGDKTRQMSGQDRTLRTNYHPDSALIPLF